MHPTALVLCLIEVGCKLSYFALCASYYFSLDHFFWHVQRHIIDADHVCVGYQHKLLEVEHLGVEFEIVRDSMVYHIVPLLLARLAFHGVSTDPIPPLVLRNVDDKSFLEF